MINKNKVSLKRQPKKNISKPWSEDPVVEYKFKLFLGEKNLDYVRLQNAIFYAHFYNAHFWCTKN